MTSSKILWSPNAGVLVDERAGQAYPRVHCIGIKTFADENAWQALSSVDDWEEIESVNVDKLLPILANQYWHSRALAFVTALMTGLSESLEDEVLDETEKLLQTRVKAKNLISLLLIAPLLATEVVSRLAKVSQRKNLHAISAIWNEVLDLQPLLNRFVGLWLKVPVSAFDGCQYPKCDLWRRLSVEGILPDLLRAHDRTHFLSSWNTLLFSDAMRMNVPSRQAFSRIGVYLGESLFPSKIDVRKFNEVEEENFWKTAVPKRKSRHHDVEKDKENALKQIDAIAGVVAEGKDALAHKFLQDLISHQIAEGDTQYVTKSLCNIAKKCADMFRLDFERECLVRALDLNPSDAWTLTQWGDHLKRVGEYDEAIRALEKAWNLNGDAVAQATIADVWEKRGNHSRALNVYRTIPGWEDTEFVRTAMGDLFRRMGHFDDAEREYDYALARWGAYRAYAGKAEILKSKMQLSESLGLYQKLIANKNVDEHSRVIYRSSSCRLLKLMGNFEEAYRTCEDIIRDYPFFMQARLQRASVLGLLGKASEGLADVPASFTSSAYGQWISYFVKGLLMLKLGKSGEARELLVGRVGSVLKSREGAAMLRFGATLAFLTAKEYSRAEAELKDIPQNNNQYAEYLRHVMQLHLAASRTDEVSLQWLSSDLKKMGNIGVDVDVIIEEIRRREFGKLLDLEIDLCLRAA